MEDFCFTLIIGIKVVLFGKRETIYFANRTFPGRFSMLYRRHGTARRAPHFIRLIIRISFIKKMSLSVVSHVYLCSKNKLIYENAHFRAPIYNIRSSSSSCFVYNFAFLYKRRRAYTYPTTGSIFRQPSQPFPATLTFPLS